jgi:glutathione reductase (NADPH)
LAEGMLVADRLFNGSGEHTDDSGASTDVFSYPNIKTVGLSEEQAIESRCTIDVYRSVFTPLKHIVSSSGDKVLLKLIGDRESARVVGVDRGGDAAGELYRGKVCHDAYQGWCVKRPVVTNANFVLPLPTSAKDVA